MTEGKQKLTLSVDAESVERAKALGINISDLTEQVLRSFTLKPEDVEENALQAQRESLFKEMTPVLKKLDAEVHIGVVDDPNGNPSEDDYLDVVLTGAGKPYVIAPDDEDGSLFPEDPARFGRIYFDSAEALVQNFMKAIEAAKTKRKQAVASFVLARKIIEAIAQVEAGSGNPSSAQPSTRRASRQKSSTRRGGRS